MPILLLILFVFLQSCGVNTVDTARDVVGEQPADHNTGAIDKGGKNDDDDNETVAKENTANRSALLTRSKYSIYNPLPNGKIGGYAADTGLDIMAEPLPTYAIAAGTLVYSERGHTPWTKGKDTPNSILLKLDKPIKLSSGRTITHAFYTHLSKLAYIQPLSSKAPRKIAAGEYLGISGYGNQIGHLHIGLLLGGQTEQSPGTYLSFTDIRTVLGSYKENETLPAK